MGTPDYSPSSLGSAEQEADAAEARLNAVLGGRNTTTNGTGGDTSNPKPPTLTLPPPGIEPNSNPTPQVDEDPCRTACDALTSMLRAVDRLCNLTGQADERCQSRRARADSASARVTQSCPSCNV
jgi:hypothetical protein